MQAEHQPLDADAFPLWGFDVLGMGFDPVAGIVEIRLAASDGVPSFTPSLSRDLLRFSMGIRGLVERRHPAADAIRYVLMTSDTPGMFSMGGDLGHFVERVEANDKAALTTYAHTVLEVMHDLWRGFGGRIVTMALLEGDALGGGYEAALVNQFVVAERGLRIGLPEVGYNFFPGMGAVSMLSRRMGEARARDFILGGKVHLSQDVLAWGGVDFLVERGEARDWVRRTLVEGGDEAYAIFLAKRDALIATHRVTHAELRAVIDAWVDNVMSLDGAERARMRRIATVQRRVVRSSRQRDASTA